MPYVAVNDLKLYYEAAGDPADPVVLLIAGLGVQMIDWPDHFVDPLVAAGHYVIRFDNRDIGLSTTFDDAPNDPQVVLAALEAGEDPAVAYTLADMANDAAELLRALEIESAHMIGVSMGGMIAQATAIGHPEKVRSLTTIMTTTGAVDVGQPTAEALAAILSPAPSDDREQRIAQGVEAARIWASPDHFDSARLRKLFEDSWNRVGGPQAENTGRHFCAIIASPPRDAELADLAVPTLVVHGDADTLISPSGGQRIAAMVPGSRLMMIEGMGHDLPPAFVPQIVEAISDLVDSVEAA